MLFEQQIRKGRIEIEKKVRLGRIGGKRGAHLNLPDISMPSCALHDAYQAAPVIQLTVVLAFDITWCAERCLPARRARPTGRASNAAARSRYVPAAHRTDRHKRAAFSSG